MSEVVTHYSQVEAALSDGAMRLLHSDYANASIAMLRSLFGDGASRFESEILYAQVDSMLDELDFAGCKNDTVIAQNAANHALDAFCRYRKRATAQASAAQISGRMRSC